MVQNLLGRKFKCAFFLFLKIFWHSFNRVLGKLKKDETKSNGPTSKKLANISLISLESECHNVESISHFILLFNYDVANIFRFHYVSRYQHRKKNTVKIVNLCFFCFSKN